MPRYKTHGLSNTREYHVWEYIIQKCTNPNCVDFGRYGGRGIYVCDRWRSFENFYTDMGPRPSLKMTIERMDNDGPYAPANCRWATQTEQKRNYSRNKMVTAFGKTAPLMEFIVGYRKMESADKPRYMRVYHRLRKGMAAEEALSAP